MKKILFLHLLLIFVYLTFYELPAYGAGDFSQYYNKGIEYYKQGKYDLAGKEFEKAIELKPNDVYALYGLGNTYYCKAKYDDAVKIYTKAISINPDYAKVHYSLSLAYSKLGMTREAEKQKSIFRKLSQGGEGTSQVHAKPSDTSTHSDIDHSPKKVLSHEPKKELHESKQVETHAAHEEKTHTTHAPNVYEQKRVEAHTTHAPSQQTDTHTTTHAPSEHEQKHVETHTTHAPEGHDTGRVSAGGSHSIFKGYSGETHKAEERVFKKKHKTFAYGDSGNSLRSAMNFIKNKWYSSRIHKIWICAAGYVFATQAWLCVVAFFCVIIWRVRERA